MIKTVFLIVCLVLAVSGSKRPTLAQIPEVSAAYAKDWYSGYLDFPFQGFTAHMHYFYFPSQTDSPEKDPLLFWFNGGPGCSSLLGALYEHGPFIFNDALGFLMENKEAWNKRANTVYIESPAQVGFSYMDIPEGSDYPTWNDDMVAELNLLALIEFFNTLPEFYQRPTYIAGESYGGIYVPTLVEKVHNFNQHTQLINLKGFAVGNGCTDASECEFINDYPHYLYILLNDVGMISDKLFK